MNQVVKDYQILLKLQDINAEYKIGLTSKQITRLARGLSDLITTKRKNE